MKGGDRGLSGVVGKKGLGGCEVERGVGLWDGGMVRLEEGRGGR